MRAKTCLENARSSPGITRIFCPQFARIPSEARCFCMFRDAVELSKARVIPRKLPVDAAIDNAPIRIRVPLTTTRRVKARFAASTTAKWSNPSRGGATYHDTSNDGLRAHKSSAWPRRCQARSGRRTRAERAAHFPVALVTPGDDCSGGVCSFASCTDGPGGTATLPGRQAPGEGARTGPPPSQPC